MGGVGAALGLVPGNPLRPFALGLLAFGGLAAIVAAVLLAVDRLWALVAGLLGLSALISLAIIVPFGRAYTRDMRRLLAGEHWAHWRYDGDERARFADQEWARARREARFGVPASMILAAAVGIFLAIVGGGQQAAALGGALILAVGLAVSVGLLLAGRARYARRARETGDVILGSLGIHHPGRYVPLRGFNLRLVDVAVERGSPAALRVRTASRSQYGTRTQETRVPIPRGREAEAEALGARFRNELGVNS